MKDINKKFKEIIDYGISGNLLILCISISIFVIGMLGLETDFNQILTLITKITGIILCFLGTLEASKILKEKYLVCKLHLRADIIVPLIMILLEIVVYRFVVLKTIESFQKANFLILIPISIILFIIMILVTNTLCMENSLPPIMTSFFKASSAILFGVIGTYMFVTNILRMGFLHERSNEIVESNDTIFLFIIITLILIPILIILTTILVLRQLGYFSEKWTNKKFLVLSFIITAIGLFTITSSYINFKKVFYFSNYQYVSFIGIGIIGLIIGSCGVFLNLYESKKHFDYSILQVTINLSKSIFYPVLGIVLSAFFTWFVISNSHDLLQLNHNMNEAFIPSCAEDTTTFAIKQTKCIIDNNKKKDSIQADERIKATQIDLTNSLETHCTEDSIVGIVTKNTMPATVDKNKNIVDWLTVFNSSIQNLLGLIMFILGAASLYYVSKQLKDSKRSREGDAFMQTFTTLLAQQHAILMKDTLTDKAFIDDNYHCPNAFCGFITYFDQHQKGTELSDIWKGYKDMLRDPASFDCCFKYFYHMIEIILANESVLYNPQKEKFYLKLIQAELNHDILFCYLVNLLVHFQDNSDSIDDLRRYRNFSTEAFGNKKLIEIKENVEKKWEEKWKDLFKYFEFNKDNLNQYFTESIIDQYKEVINSSQETDKIIETILNKEENKKLKDVFSQRIINKFKKKNFYNIFPDENPENNRTNKCAFNEEELTILAQYHFFNDLRLDVDFIERIWKIANIGFDRIKTPNNGTETNTPCSDRFLEVSYTGTALNILFDKDENRLVVCVEDNKEIGYNYFRGAYSSSQICPHIILQKDDLNINYNEVNPIDYIIITKNTIIKINGEEIDDDLVQKLNTEYHDTIFNFKDNILEIKNTVQNIYIQNSTKNRYVRNLRLLTGFFIKKEKVIENKDENKKWLLYGIDRYEEAVQNNL